MAFVIGDRIAETSVTSGTGNITLGGAQSGYKPFSSELVNGDTTWYVIVARDDSNWEVGIGTYISGTQEISRNTVISSSNSNNLVNFNNSVKDVFISLPSDKTVYIDPTDTVNIANANITATLKLNNDSGIAGQVLTSGGVGTIPSWQEPGATANVICQVRNSTGATLTKGTAVYISGAIGQLPTVSKAIATSDDTSAQTLGVMNADLANNSTGFVTIIGLVDDVDTSAFNDGDQLYLSSTVAGTYTATKQYAPNHLVYIAVVQHAHPVHGKLFVKVQNGYELDEIHNVSAQTPSNGQTLVYNSTNSLWEQSNSPVISNSTINSTTIGATTASTGAFTSVTTPSVTATTTDLTLSAISTGAINFNTLNGTQVKITDVATGTGQYTLLSRHNGNNTQKITAANTANLALQATGGGGIYFRTGDDTPTQALISHTISAVNFVQVTGGATTAAPSLAAQGSDASVSLQLASKGGGVISFVTNGVGSGIQTTISHTPSSVNYFTTTGAATGFVPRVFAQGADTNISMAFQPKGTGAIDLAAGTSGVNISNGNTVTAITRTNAGIAYTVIPTIALSAPTTAGGVQATATCTMNVWGASLASGGTGYTVGDVLTAVGGTGTAVNVTVATLGAGNSVATVTYNNYGNYSVLPTNPVTLSGGTGTGCTFNYTYSVNIITIGNAGSGYVEQPSVTFTGAASTPASAYADIGTSPIIKSLNTNMRFLTSQGEAVRITGGGLTLTDYVELSGGVSGVTNGVYVKANGSSTNQSLYLMSKGTTGNVGLYTNWSTAGALQFQASHTASAVNWVQVTGAVTTGSPLISAQGSDANPHLLLSGKGSGGVKAQTYFQVGYNYANYLSLSGSNTNQALTTSAAGSDTNVPLAFITKGTGAIDLAAGSRGVNISNGGTVTAITRTSAGNGYTSIPTVAVSAPTTAGGVQAVLAITMAAQSGTAVTPANGGTGYTLNDVLTLVGGTFTQVAQFTVTGVSAGVVTQVTRNNTTNFGNYTVLPTSPAATTGGTGTGCTLNMLWEFLLATITNAGSGYIEQPTITFSGGGGSSAAAYASVGGATSIKGLGGTIELQTAQGRGFLVYESGTVPANYWSTRASSAGALPILYAQGSDTNVGGVISSKGTGQLIFQTNGAAQTQFLVAHTASAVNYVQVTGATTSNRPTLSAQGSDASVGLNYATKSTAPHAFYTNTNNLQAAISHTANPVNYINFTGSVSTAAPTISSAGTDTNISINLVPKGTGTVQQNGNPLAQVNHKYHAFNVGSYYYDTYEQVNFFRLFTQNATADTIRYGAVTSPEYYDYGTSTWTAWAAGQTGIQNLLDGNQSTGMDVAHANRTFRFIVNASDGYPTNTLILLQSTWSAVTYTTATVTIESSTTVGGTYTSRQVMVFSPANTGNNWGMHAYYASTLHTGNTFYRITIDLTDWVDNTTYTTYPLRNLSIYSNYSNIAGRQDPFSTAFDKTTSFIGGIRTAADVNGVLDLGRYSSANPSTIIDTGSNATSISFRTQYNTQFQVANTTSAVNYVQVSGGSAGNGVNILAAGSDTNINAFVISKGASSIVMQTNGKENFRVADGGTSVVNNLQAVGSNTGFGPTLQARGSDTNIDITLTPKGTGRVKFGTLTATADAPITGYIEIVDSSGTIRKLAVIS